jgi:Phospholipase_D-nuclease N-terminal
MNGIYPHLRSHDLSAWAKVSWLILVIVLPFMGVFTYLTVRGAPGRRAGRDSRRPAG